MVVILSSCAGLANLPSAGCGGETVVRVAPGSDKAGSQQHLVGGPEPHQLELNSSLTVPCYYVPVPPPQTTLIPDC